MGFRKNAKAVREAMKMAKEAREEAARNADAFGTDATGGIAPHPGLSIDRRNDALADHSSKIARAQALSAELAQLQGGGADAEARRSAIETELAAMWGASATPTPQQESQIEQLSGLVGGIDPAPGRGSAGPGASLGSGPLEIRLNEASYGPGDTVSGTVVVTEDVKARSIGVELRYLDEASSGYAGSVVAASSGPLQQGDLPAGAELPFSLRMPADALPSWSGDPGSLQTKQILGMTMTVGTSPGSLRWVVGADVDIARRRDISHDLSLPLDPNRTRWAGPPPATGPLDTKSVGRRFDAEAEPDRWSLRRGESLDITVRVGKPSPDRELEAGLICVMSADEDVSDTDAEGHTTTSRETTRSNLLELLAPIDAAQATQTVTVQVPDGAPFSCPHRGRGAALGFEWWVVVREPRRMRRDPRREAAIQVLP